MEGHHYGPVIEFALQADEGRHGVDVTIVAGLLLQEGAIRRPQIVRVNEEAHRVHSEAECLFHLMLITESMTHFYTRCDQFSSHLSAQVVLLEEVAVIHPQIDAHARGKLLLEDLR